MKQDFIDQTIALSAVIQAAMAVDSLATTGLPTPVVEKGLIYSIFQTNPNTMEDIYENFHNLNLGLQTLSTSMMKSASPNALRYFASLIALQRKLNQHDDLLQILSHGIQATETRLEHFAMEHDNILASLADIYTQTVSKLSPRIMVQGDPQILMQESIKNRVRTLLLAGIRSAMLWRQRGGNRFTLLFSQGKITQCAQTILSTL